MNQILKVKIFFKKTKSKNKKKSDFSKSRLVVGTTPRVDDIKNIH